MKLTDKQYDLLIYCFRNHYNDQSTKALTHIPIHRIEREKQRWKLCQAISALGRRQTNKQLSNGGKTFGVRYLNVS